jgi:phosphate starvation-inducible PhoH-like protein
MAPSALAIEEFFGEPITRKERKRKIKEIRKQQSTQQPVLRSSLEPLTDGQRKTFEAFAAGKNLILHGVAGTGKTFISLGLALNAVFTGQAPKPVVIIRSVVPTRDMGFLPGNQKEKSAVYEAPYEAICSEIMPRQFSYEYLKNKGYIEFSTTSFLRGLTFRNNTIIVDECQNLTFHELDSVITRMGEGSRVIFCGDFRQSDLWREDERGGLNKFMSIVTRMKSFERIEFNKEDIVRSDVVREYILAKLEQGIV